MNWKVVLLECFPEWEGRPNVVCRVHWRLEGNGKALNGMCSVPYRSEAFVDFDALTEDRVLGWIWANGVNKEDMEQSLNAPAPELARPALPW